MSHSSDHFGGGSPHFAPTPERREGRRGRTETRVVLRLLPLLLELIGSTSRQPVADPVDEEVPGIDSRRDHPLVPAVAIGLLFLALVTATPGTQTVDVEVGIAFGALLGLTYYLTAIYERARRRRLIRLRV
jgi:hypothetical protein